MATPPSAPAPGSPARTSRSRRRAWLATLACLATAPLIAALAAARNASDTLFYSTAAPPVDYPGPVPGPVVTEPATPRAAVPTLALTAAPARRPSPTAEIPAPNSARPAPAPPAADPIAEAKARIAACARTYAALKDYTCVFFKRERIDGKLTSFHTMHMKARTQPHSIYFKFVTPTAGREAIYVAGAFGGKAVVHDVGLGKLLAGTLRLDPRGSMAMEECRHPITEAGLGHMIETILTAWNKELTPDESRVEIHPDAKVGDRDCLMIESVHPQHRPDFLFHMVKVYIDKELNVPIRFEAYDWPKGGRAPDLVEEYTYSKLKLDVGLTARDFDPNNKSYSFGRF